MSKCLRTNELSVRHMSYKDLDAIMAIEVESFTSPWSWIHFKNEIDNVDHSDAVVVDYGEQMIAYAVAWKIVDEYHLANIAVDPTFRCIGIGSYLLDLLLARARQLGFANVLLEVRQSNKAAIDFYEKFGFHIVGRRKNYYCDSFSRMEDAILMNLPLRSGVLA